MSDTLELMDDENGPSQMSGYLYKKASGGEWQRRYFETNGAYLTYYKTHKMTKLLAALSVPQVGAIKILGSADESKDGPGGIFQIDLKDRQYVLKAESEEDAEKWVNFLIELRDSKSRPTSNPMATPAPKSRSLVSDDGSTTPLSIEQRPAAASIQKTKRTNCLCICFGLRD